MAAKKTDKKYTYAVGKRKSSSARVRLYKGKGQSLVNDLPVEKYFPGPVNTSAWTKPFRLTDTLDKFHFSARIIGGGKSGQLDAITHGIARALNQLDKEKFRAPLKAEGLLTRDARTKERRKIGTGGKARRKKQSPKR